MPEAASFIAITESALRTLSKRQSTWWIALPVGWLIWKGSQLTSEAGALLNQVDTERFVEWLIQGQNTNFWILLGGSLFVALLKAPFRGILFLLLQKEPQPSENPKNQKVSPKELFRGAIFSFFFEFGYWCAIALIGLILSISCLLAWRFNPSVFASVVEIALLLLIGISAYLYFIKELASLYCILGRTSPRGSIDLGIRLFRRHSFLILLFFVYLSLIALTFSFLTNAIMTSVERLFGFTRDGLLLAGSTLFLFGTYYLFDQSLRLAFFRSIAATPKQPVTKQPATKPIENAPSIMNG